MRRKFYVECGNLSIVILGHDAINACENALRAEACHNGITLGPSFYVSERGFIDGDCDRTPEDIDLSRKQYAAEPIIKNVFPEV